MSQYLITRKMNGHEYFLEDIEKDNRVIWCSTKKKAFRFDNEWDIKQFIKDTFPGRDYYITKQVSPDDWGFLIKPKGYRIT